MAFPIRPVHAPPTKNRIFPVQLAQFQENLRKPFWIHAVKTVRHMKSQSKGLTLATWVVPGLQLYSSTARDSTCTPWQCLIIT